MSTRTSALQRTLSTPAWLDLQQFYQLVGNLWIALCCWVFDFVTRAKESRRRQRPEFFRAAMIGCGSCTWKYESFKEHQYQTVVTVGIKKYRWTKTYRQKTCEILTTLISIHHLDLTIVQANKWCSTGEVAIVQATVLYVDVHCGKIHLSCPRSLTLSSAWCFDIYSCLFFTMSSSMKCVDSWEYWKVLSISCCGEEGGEGKARNGVKSYTMGIVTLWLLAEMVRSRGVPIIFVHGGRRA